MANHEQNQTEQENVQQTSSIAPSNSRRKFFKKATVGSALIASAASQPVWGSCVSSISGNLSGNVSTQEATTAVFAGRSPSFYVNAAYDPNENEQTEEVHAESNAIPESGIFIPELGTEITYTSNFQELFSSPSGSTNTIQHILVTRGSQSERFERHFVNAVLNSQTMPDFPYTFTELNDFLLLVESGQLSKSEAIPILRFLIDGFADDTNTVQCGT